MLAGRMGVNGVGSRDSANLDREDVGKANLMIVAQEHQLSVDFGEGPPVGHAAVETPFLEAEDGAVRCSARQRSARRRSVENG